MTARNTAPSTANPCNPCVWKKVTPWRGSIAESTIGALTIQLHPEDSDRDEPQHHHRTEQPADAVRAVLLDGEDPDQNDDRDRHDIRIDQRCRDRQAFDRAQHGDRRRNHAVPVQQRRAENAERDQHRARRAAVARRCPTRCGTSAVRARMPPSPRLSARITMAMYLTEMTTSSA